MLVCLRFIKRYAKIGGVEMEERIPQELLEMFEKMGAGFFSVSSSRQKREPVKIALPEEARRKLEYLFEAFLELIQDNKEQVNDFSEIKNELKLMQKDLLHNEETDTSTILSVGITIKAIIEKLINYNKIYESATDNNNFEILLAEYVEKQKNYTQIPLARKILAHVNMTKKLVEIANTWNEAIIIILKTRGGTIEQCSGCGECPEYEC